MGYDVLVMALNKKGKSGPVMLQGYTVKNPEKQTGTEREIMMAQLPPFVMLIAFSFLSFLYAAARFSCFPILRLLSRLRSHIPSN